MQPNTPLNQNNPPDISDVDQKLHEEYVRNHPIDPRSLNESPLSKTINWVAYMWRYNKKICIPVVGSLLLIVIVAPIFIGNSNSKSETISNLDPSDPRVTYYSEDDPELDATTDDGEEDSSTSANETSLPGESSEDQTVNRTQQPIRNNSRPAANIPAVSTISEDEAFYELPEPIETGGPIEEPEALNDSPDDETNVSSSGSSSNSGNTGNNNGSNNGNNNFNPIKTPDTPTGKLNAVNIVTFNYAHFKPASGINDAVRKLSGTADVIGFQEFGPKSHREALSQVVRDCKSCDYALYMPDISNGGNIPIVWKKSKFQLVSKGNLKVYDKQRVEDGAGGPEVTAKHITWVRLKDKQSGRVFVAMNNHLIPTVEANGHPNRTKPQRLALHNKHLTTLANIAKKFKDQGTAVFITGDFNVNYRLDSRVKAPSFPYVTLGKVGIWANWHYLGVLPGSTHEGTRLIDYVFVSKGTNTPPISHKILPKNGSDHSPLLTRIELRQNKK